MTGPRGDDGANAALDTDAHAAVSVTDLVLQYPDGDRPAVDGVSLDVDAGRLTALVGPNGSGKSTLLKGVSSQLAPEAGHVVLDGRAVAAYDDTALARKLGILHQETEGPGRLTVEQLAFHGRYPHRGFLEPTTDADVAAVDRALSLTGVDRLRDRPLADLSGGQRRLAWLAMVLAQETEVLLLDEPTTFLDLRHQLAVMDVVGRLRDERDTTVVVVLHDIEQAARYADDLVVLSDGAVAARGPPSAVVTADLLADVFGVEAAVGADEHGVRIRPIRPIDRDVERRS
jgi:iron complex transport system ATP-binding protein